MLLRPLCTLSLAISLLGGGEARDLSTVEFVGSNDGLNGSVITAVRRDGADTPLSPLAQRIDARTQGRVKDTALTRMEAIAAGTIADVALPGGAKSGNVYLAALPFAPLAPRDIEDFGGKILQSAAGSRPGPLTVAMDLPEVSGMSAGERDARLAFGAVLASYRFDKYLTGSPTAAPALRIVSADPAAASAAWRELQPLARAVAFARDLINEPGNVIYPESFIARVRNQLPANVQMTVLGPEDMMKAGMGAILGVAQGSARPPRLLVLEYRGGGAKRLVALAGKGVTFDSGGLAIKDGDGMWKMKYDMSGAAAVAATVMQLAARNAKVNVVAVAALVENMPDGNAQRPGDIVKSLSGKTIEVINPDAEGRLILADAITYAQRTFRPSTVIDIATLTGTVRQALGTDYGGMFHNDPELGEQLLRAGQLAGEDLWHLPLNSSHEAAVQSHFADLRNSVEGANQPGPSIGAAFISAFVEPGVRWAHLDIGSVGWQYDASATVPQGGAGFGVRLLDRWFRSTIEAKQ